MTGDNTGCTLDSSISNSDAAWHNIRRDRSDRHSPDRRVASHDSTSSGPTREAPVMLIGVLMQVLSQSKVGGWETTEEVGQRTSFVRRSSEAVHCEFLHNKPLILITSLFTTVSSVYTIVYMSAT